MTSLRVGLCHKNEPFVLLPRCLTSLPFALIGNLTLQKCETKTPHRANECASPDAAFGHIIFTFQPQSMKRVDCDAAYKTT